MPQDFIDTHTGKGGFRRVDQVGRRVVPKSVDSVIACPVCACVDVVEAMPMKSTVGLFDGRGLVRCPACSLVFVGSPPSKAELDTMNARYWEAAQALDALSERFHDAQMTSRIDYAKARIGSLSDLKVLDVGAGDGAFQRALRSRGHSGVYHAIEPDPTGHERMLTEGAQFVWSDLSSCSSDNYDLIVLFHVLEHVTDPHRLLIDLRDRLRPGGILFVEVPNQDYRFQPQLGTHLLFFAPNALQVLLDRTSFRTLALDSVGQPISHLAVRAAQSPIRKPLKRLLPSKLRSLVSHRLDPARAARQTPEELRTVHEMDILGEDRGWLRSLAITTPDA